MNHRFIAVLEEGPSQGRFVKNNPDPWLSENFSTNIQPVIYTTKINPGGKHYIQMFEFEALLLSCPDSLLRIYPERKESARDLINEVSRYSTPEEINDGSETHPAARPEKCFPGYRKIPDSQQILRSCTIDMIRKKCPRFDTWITKLTVYYSTQSLQ